MYSARLRIVIYDIREAVDIAVHARLCVRGAVRRTRTVSYLIAIGCEPKCYAGGDEYTKP